MTDQPTQPQALDQMAARDMTDAQFTLKLREIARDWEALYPALADWIEHAADRIDMAPVAQPQEQPLVSEAVPMTPEQEATLLRQEREESEEERRRAEAEMEKDRW